MRQESFTSTKRLILFCIGLVIALSYQNGGGVVESVTTISSEGGYTFTIAIDENVPQPADEAAFLAYRKRIGDNIQRFSLHLFQSTRGYFHVKTVQLLLPKSWTLDLTDPIDTATTESYSNADIRLSTVNYPFVLNPNQCGLPGKYIELPHTFFTGQTDDDKYGSLEKAFLTQWARFRWGVWEEHGYPSDEKFPYFYKHVNSTGEEWKTTGCSNVELEGEYTNTAGQLCTPSDADTTTCRFRPKPTNVATSSLMGFHWLENVKHFCDETTHNKLAPNKQNLFCDYQSVWKVIQSTPDFVGLLEPSEIIPTVIVTPVKPNMAPVFHLLLDRGLIMNESISVYGQVIHGLLPLFRKESRQILGAVSAFSSESGRPTFTNLVEWRLMGPNAADFIEAIADVRTDFPPLKDFSYGLLEVTKSIENLQPDGTPIILIIKSGATETYFGTAQSEAEIFASLSKSRARLFVGEIPNTAELPFVNLRDLALKTGGSHTAFSKTNGVVVQEQIKSLVDLIANLLDATEHFPINDKTQVMFQDTLAPADSKTIIQPNGIQDVQVHLTLSASLVPSLTVGGTVMPGTSRNEWDEANDFGRRLVHTYNIPASNQGDLTIAYTCPGCNTDTSAFLLVVGQLAEAVRDEVIVNTETNAVRNIVDFGLNPSSPFALHTTVLFNNRPIRNVVVEATITNSNNFPTIVSLEDNGLDADFAAGDGIYSGIYIPEVDGVHRLSIKIEATQSNNPKEIGATQLSSRLLPIDQDQIGCPASDCGEVDYDGSFVKFSTVEDIEFRNVQLFERGRPSKILDLEAFAIYNTVTDQTTLRLTFTSPKIIGVSDTTAKATKYYVAGSDNFNNLIAPEFLGDIVCQIADVKPPGSDEVVEEFVCPSLTASNRFLYYVVYSYYSDFPTIPVDRTTKSNIAQVLSITVTEDPPTTEDPNTEPTEGPTSEAPEKEKKAFFKRAGGIVLIVFLVLLVAGAIGGGIFYFLKRNQTNKHMV